MPVITILLLIDCHRRSYGMQYKHYVLRSLRMLTKRPECLLYVPPVEHNLNHIPDRVVLNLWLVEQFDATEAIASAAPAAPNM